ncbi:MAG TPA: tyrosine--tRNA ligase [Lentisphaeria bacterium]|nr:MAG: tyrosine--tRNA ligase [Lentisphaerae bacterium GWF2_49_21]HBC89058.1 tyrosine--tRNA ligase [Lentisphaeria bacterium]
MASNCFSELKDRNFIYQTTDDEKIPEILNKGKNIFYAGFDPTADSLHVGHLLPVMAIRHLQSAGNIPIVLVGGATALVGDPSGKQEARPIMSKDKVAENAAAIKKQLASFIDTSNAIFVNNADWFCNMLYIDFLRDVGHRFSVNKMLTAESVKLRLETGLSFLEFNYMLLQAYDFYILNKEHRCTLQIGGQDQWGNIVAGVDLVRRMSSNEAYGMTMPLLTNDSGEKFGKTVAGAVWLDPKRTSIFDYYQFWRNTDDSQVEKLLKYFTVLPVEEIERLASLQAPAINRAKEILAFEATKLAHGQEAATKAYLAACSKFGYSDPKGEIETSSSIKSISADTGSIADLPTYKVSSANFADKGMWIVKLMTESGLCTSSSDARRLIKGGGAYVNDTRISDENATVRKEDFSKNALILKAGKKNVRRIVLEE